MAGKNKVGESTALIGLRVQQPYDALKQRPPLLTIRPSSAHEAGSVIPYIPLEFLQRTIRNYFFIMTPQAIEHGELGIQIGSPLLRGISLILMSLPMSDLMSALTQRLISGSCSFRRARATGTSAPEG